MPSKPISPAYCVSYRLSQILSFSAFLRLLHGHCSASLRAALRPLSGVGQQQQCQQEWLCHIAHTLMRNFLGEREDLFWDARSSGQWSGQRWRRWYHCNKAKRKLIICLFLLANSLSSCFVQRRRRRRRSSMPLWHDRIARSSNKKSLVPYLLFIVCVAGSIRHRNAATHTYKEPKTITNKMKWLALPWLACVCIVWYMMIFSLQQVIYTTYRRHYLTQQQACRTVVA